MLSYHEALPTNYGADPNRVPQAEMDIQGYVAAHLHAVVDLEVWQARHEEGIRLA